MSDLRAECRGRIEYRVGTGDGLLHWLVIPRLTGFTERPAKVVFSTHNLRSGDIIRRVQETRLEFGIVRSDAVTSGVQSLSIGRMEFCGVIPRALCKKKPPSSITEFCELPLAVMSTDGQFTDRIKDAAKRHGVTMNVTLACESHPQAIAAVQTGRYAAIVPCIAMKSLGPQFVEFRHAAFKPLARDLSLIWHPRMLEIRPLGPQVCEHMKTTFSQSI